MKKDEKEGCNFIFKMKNNKKKSLIKAPKDEIYYSTNQLIHAMKDSKSSINVVPDLFKNIFLVSFDVATGNEYQNEKYLNLNSLPLGFHSAFGPGKYQPQVLSESIRYKFFYFF